MSDTPTDHPEPGADGETDVVDPIAPEDFQSIIGISFSDRFRAQEFLTAMTRLRSRGELTLADAVVVAKDEDGNTKVTETIDPTPGRTALGASLWTGLIGFVVAGPVGWAVGAAAGAGAGAVTAKVVDLGIPDEWVEWFQEAVAPGTATVVILAGDVDEDALVAEVDRFAGAQLVHADASEEMQARLRAALDRR